MKNIDFGAEVAKVLPIIIREVTKRGESVFTKGDISVPQIVILELLAEKGLCKMGELAETLSLTMSAITAIVDKMIKMKVVKRERSKEDRRVVRVLLLDKGSQMVETIRKERRDNLNNMFSVLTDNERKEYLRLITKVREGIQKRNE